MYGYEITSETTQAAAAVIVSFVAIMGLFSKYVFQPATRSIEQKIDDKLDPLELQIAEIKKEVTINSGKSLKDAVLTTRDDLIDLRARFEQENKHHATEQHAPPYSYPDSQPGDPGRGGYRAGL